MRAQLSVALAALTMLVAGCENRSGTTVASPSPRISPVAAPAPPPVVPQQVARATP
jgi:hypothetical protein